jgi:hypothetical protein
MPESADPIVVAALAEFDAGGGAARLTAQLSASPDPEASMRRFAEVARLLYAPRRNLAAMLAVAQGGVAYGKAQAERAGSEIAGARLRQLAMRLGYNVAANGWPGWGDEGVNPTAEQVSTALAMAEDSLALRRDFEVGADRMDRGHWLVGALQMAVGRNAEAAASFLDAEAASEGDGKLMARGYRALVDMRDPAQREEGEAALAGAIAALEHSTGEEAAAFIAQLRTAERIFE